MICYTTVIHLRSPHFAMYEPLSLVLNTLTTNVLQQLTEIPAALALLMSELILCFIYNNANTPGDVHEISKWFLFPMWTI